MNSELAAFFDQFPEQTLRKGETLIQSHEAPPGVILLLEGIVAQYDIAEGGQKVAVNIFRPHAFFPMSWAINQTENTYIFEAGATIRYRVAPPQATVDFLVAHPDILLDLLGRVYRGTDGLQRRMALLMSGDAYKRLLFELFIMCQRFGTQQADGSYEMDIIEEDLAMYTGLARETVSRQLQRLKEEGMVQGIRGKITIPDMDRVKQALGQS